MNKRMGFCGDFKVVMSLNKSPLATSSGVGLSGWAMLQWGEVTIRYGCNVESDNDRVHTGLVFTLIVMRSLSSFHYSTFILLSLLTSWWSSFQWLLLWSDTFRRVRPEDWNRGVARGACCLWSVWADLPVPEFVILHLDRFPFVVAALWWKALMPGGGELWFPKPIPRGDISISPFEIGREGRGGGNFGDLPATVSFVFFLSLLCFSFLCFFCSFLCVLLIIAHSLFLLCGDANAPFTGFLLY